MEIINEIKEEIKKNNVIYGFKKCLKYIKLNTPKFVILAKNIPENMKNDILFAVRDKKKIIEVDMTSKELGIALGKPFPISTIVVKNEDI